MTSAAAPAHRRWTRLVEPPRLLCSATLEGAGVPGEVRPPPASPCPGLGHVPTGNTTQGLPPPRRALPQHLQLIICWKSSLQSV